MRYRVIVPATAEPVTLEQARMHLRLDVNTDTSPPENPEDPLIDGLITTAREWCEQYINAAIAPQTIEAASDSFWANPADLRLQVGFGAFSGFVAQRLCLPFGPVASVASLKYIDVNGTLVTMDPAGYVFNPFTFSLDPAWGAPWPATRWIESAVRVQYVAGYGNAGFPLPRAIPQAMLLLIAHWFSNRESVVVDSRVAATEVPMATTALLQPYRRQLGV